MLCVYISVSPLRGAVGRRRLWEKTQTKLDGKPGSRDLTPETPGFGQKESNRTEIRDAKTVKLESLSVVYRLARIRLLLGRGTETQFPGV